MYFQEVVIHNFDIVHVVIHVPHIIMYIVIKLFIQIIQVIESLKPL